jgi:hypothetical protein
MWPHVSVQHTFVCMLIVAYLVHTFVKTRA